MVLNNVSKRRIISPPPRGAQSGQSGRRHEVNLYFPVLAILCAVRRRVTEDVLVMEGLVYLSDRIGEIVEIVDREQPPPRLLRQFGKRLHAAGDELRANPDSKEANITLTEELLDFLLRIATIVVAAIGDDHQRLAGIYGSPHVVNRQRDGVKQRRPSLRHDRQQGVLHCARVSCKAGKKLRPVAKLDQRVLVTSIGSTKKSRDGFTRLVELAHHASARVKKNPHRHRRIVVFKMSDALLDPIFKELKGFRIESQHWLPDHVSNGDGYKNQCRLNAQGAFGRCSDRPRAGDNRDFGLIVKRMPWRGRRSLSESKPSRDQQGCSEDLYGGNRYSDWGDYRVFQSFAWTIIAGTSPTHYRISPQE